MSLGIVAELSSAEAVRTYQAITGPQGSAKHAVARKYRRDRAGSRETCASVIQWKLGDRRQANIGPRQWPVREVFVAYLKSTWERDDFFGQMSNELDRTAGFVRSVLQRNFE